MSSAVGSLHASVILTDACNLRCGYCPAPRRSVALSEAHLAKLVSLLLASAAPRIDLNLHGGEPLLAWDRLRDLCDRVKLHVDGGRFTCNASTNGTMLDPGRAAFLAGHAVHVRVSIDGCRADHVRHRRREGSVDAIADRDYEATLAGLRAAVAAGARTSANMVVTPETVGNLLRNAAFLTREGLDAVTVSPVLGRDWSDEALLELDRQTKGLADLWSRLLEEGHVRGDDLSRVLRDEIARARYCQGNAENRPGSRIVVVGADGRIYGDEPDSETEPDLQVGHLDSAASLDDLPRARLTAFQARAERALDPPGVVLSRKRTYRLLEVRLVAAYEALFGAPPECGCADDAPSGASAQ